MTLEEKLAAFDAEIGSAYSELVMHLLEHRTEIVALARERHVWGHEAYGDGLLFELDAGELADERDQELADGIVYQMIRRRKARHSRP